MDRLTVVVLAAGLGTRFGGCKQLAPVGAHGEAILDVVLARAASTGVSDAVIVIRAELADAFTAHLAAHRPPFPVQLVVQPVVAGYQRPLGTAHAVFACRDALDGPFVAVNADDAYPLEAFTLLTDHLRRTREHALVAFLAGQTLVGERPVSRALVDIGRDDNLVAVHETSVQRSTARGDEWVSMNMWGFQPSVFDALAVAVAAHVDEHRPGEVRLPDVVTSVAASGETVRVLFCRERCAGVTYPEDVAVVAALLG